MIMWYVISESPCCPYSGAAGAQDSYIRHASVHISGSVKEKFFKLRKENSTTTVKCYSSTPINSIVTIQLSQSQMQQFKSHKLRHYSSTPMKSEDTIEKSQSQMLKFSSHNLRCYNSTPINTGVKIQFP